MTLENFMVNATRATVSKTIDGVIKYVNKDRQKNMRKMIDMSEKMIGNRVDPNVFDTARKYVDDPDCKWMQYTNKLLDECLQEIVKKSGSVSTDLQSPETAEHLCGKCISYANNWDPVAEQLVKENPPKKKIKKGHSTYYGSVE